MIHSDYQYPDTPIDIEDTTSYIVARNSMESGVSLQEIVPGQIIRPCDPKGCGSYGASRGDGKHWGVDIITYPNQKIYSPLSGTITRYPKPYADDPRYNGIEVVNDQGVKCKLFYVNPLLPIGKKVKKGELIAASQDISKKYSRITIHAHAEVYQGNTILDPTYLFKEKIKKKITVKKGILVMTSLAIAGLVIYKLNDNGNDR